MKQREGLIAVVTSMKRQIANPMFAWETGQVVDVNIVEYWKDELEAILEENKE